MSASRDLSPTITGATPESAATTRPKIFAFSNVRGGGDGIALAMAEDGTVLGSHWCSHEGYVSYDLGVTPGSRADRHETYAAHYPAGYDMEFVRAADVAIHAGLTRAFELNQIAGAAAKAEQDALSQASGEGE